MMDDEKNEVEEFADYIFDYWRIAQTPLPNLSAKEMAELGEKINEGIRAGLEETEDENAEPMAVETMRGLQVQVRPQTLKVKIESGVWSFGDGEITFTRNDGTVETIYKNGILYGEEEQ